MRTSPPLPAAAAALHAEIASAEAQRDALPPGGRVERALRAAGLEAEATLPYSDRAYPLAEALTEALELPCALEALHSVLPHFSPDASRHSD
eukprot:2154359-Prymnesium_polylepis.1